MADRSHIEWTDASWNPLTGCTRVSEGCRHCYAERTSARLAENPTTDRYRGVARFTDRGPRWTGSVRFHPEVLDQPLRWRKPRRVFVCSMSDLFHPEVTDEQIAAIFGVMAACPQHTFQVLTKRPERAADWLRTTQSMFTRKHHLAWFADALEAATSGDHPPDYGTAWPLLNVWLGCSVEDQATADERIPHLLACPAAVRFVSYEPALAAVGFRRWLAPEFRACFRESDAAPSTTVAPDAETAVAVTRIARAAAEEHGSRFIDWIIVGGESGPGARPFDVAWARSTIEQCREAGVACFVKQLGRRVHGSPEGFRVDRYILCDPCEWQPAIIGFDRRRFEQANADRIVGFKLFDPKGGDPAEWPEDLRVREWPA